eukprot:2461703-Rhodomonas_salina.1
MRKILAAEGGDLAAEAEVGHRLMLDPAGELGQELRDASPFMPPFLPSSALLSGGIPPVP